MDKIEFDSTVGRFRDTRTGATAADPLELWGRAFDDGRLTPGDFATRDDRYAFDVKVRGTTSAADFESLRAELGIEGLVAPSRPGLGASAFSEDWIEERFFARHAEGAEYYALRGFAQENAMDMARECAREIFGKETEVSLEGRSGGWLVATGGSVLLPDAVLVSIEAHYGATAARAAGNEDAADKLEDCAPNSRDDIRWFLTRLAEFGRQCELAVADFPRAVAWQIGANCFQALAQEHQNEQAREETEKRLLDAVSDMVDGSPYEEPELTDALREARDDYKRVRGMS